MTGYNKLFRQVEQQMDTDIVSRATDLRNSVNRRVFIETSVLLPSMFLFSLSLIQPVTSAFVPLYARSLGIEVGSVTWYYLANGLAVIIGQAALGRIGDPQASDPLLKIVRNTRLNPMARAEAVIAVANTGVDTSQGSSTDPLINLVRASVTKGGGFVARVH